MILGPKDLEVVEFLGANEDEKETLQEAFEEIWKPFSREAGVSAQALSEAYTTASYYYAVAKDRKRQSRQEEGGYYSESTIQSQLVEDYMEALVKALDKAIMVSLSLARHGG